MLVEVPTVLDSLVKTDPGLRPLIDRLDLTQRSRAWNDGKVTAHHGIIPTLEPANLGHERQGTGRLPTDPRALPGAVPAPPRVRPDSGAARLRRQSLVAVGGADRRGGWRQVMTAPEESDGITTTPLRSQVLPALRAGLSRQVGSMSI